MGLVRFVAHFLFAPTVKNSPDNSKILLLEYTHSKPNTCSRQIKICVTKVQCRKIWSTNSSFLHSKHTAEKNMHKAFFPGAFHNCLWTTSHTKTCIGCNISLPNELEWFKRRIQLMDDQLKEEWFAWKITWRMNKPWTFVNSPLECKET